MGQTDLASNSLASHPDVFADIINTIIYKGRTVLKQWISSLFMSTAPSPKRAGSRDFTATTVWKIFAVVFAM